jgi:hypothetical protein
MRFQVKPRIIALTVRVMLPILSMSGSGPQTAALNEAARTEAGLVSPALTQDASITAHGDSRSRGLPWPAFDWKSSTIMELTDGLAQNAVADATTLDFIRRCFLIQDAW